MAQIEGWGSFDEEVLRDREKPGSLYILKSTTSIRQIEFLTLGQSKTKKTTINLVKKTKTILSRSN